MTVKRGDIDLCPLLITATGYGCCSITSNTTLIRFADG